MPTIKAVSVESLLRANEDYQNTIKTLPFIALQEVAAALKLNILYVTGEDKIINQRRASGLLKPYFPGCTEEQKREIIKFVEMSLKPELCYIDTYDNVTNYKEKKVLSNAGEKVDNKNKKHPLEYQIIKAQVDIFDEDVVSALFFGERNEELKVPTASFNGFFTVLDLLKTAGYISAAEGNYKTTGAVTHVPATPSKAYDTVKDFILSAHPLLRSGKVQLTVSQSVITELKKSYKAMCNSFADPKFSDLLESLRDDTMCPGLDICTHACLGTGSKMMLHKPGLFDVGRHEGNGGKFCEVRKYGVDPNELQFWIQDAFGTRVQDVHAKVFCMNEQANTAPSGLYGDYTPKTEA